MEHAARSRVRAPELSGREWLNTGGRRLRLADLRGKFVLLDFWTFCCVNCLHVLEELRPIEAKYVETLVVLGVHSPKFVHEADPAALRSAVERYAVHHPVLDDPDLETWQAYTVRAWPTLTLIDPEGYIVAEFAGEGHGHAIDALLSELVPAHDIRSTLRRSGSPYVPATSASSTLRFPSKAIGLSDGQVLVADTGDQSLAVLAPDLTTVVRRIGSSDRGFYDGGPTEARFREPSGLCALPPGIAAQVGYSIVVADTANHAIRGLRLESGEVRTLAGSGRQWMPGDSTSAMSSPWDVAWYQDRVWIAMAGIHQLWTYDPVTGALDVGGGTTNEGLLDGPLAQAWFAQPSGLAVSADGRQLWIADSETSALRVVEDGDVRTVIGSGLFDFGFTDGPVEQSALQHPLGVAVRPDGVVLICDTYNGAVRRYDPHIGLVTTVQRDLAEPSGAFVDGDALVVVESAKHRLLRFSLSAADRNAQQVQGFSHHTQRRPTELSAGEVDLVVVFEPAPGQRLDDTDGAPIRLHVSSTPDALLREGAGKGTELTRRLVLDNSVGDGVLHIAAMAATCDVDADHPTCDIHQQDWGVPILLTPDAPSRLELVLSGARSVVPDE